MSYSPWGHKELDTTERLHFHFSLMNTYLKNNHTILLTQCSND